MARPPIAPAECAQCGAVIPAGARACPECGADERTGWREISVYDGVEFPTESETDETSARRPPHSSNPIGYSNRRINGVVWYWWAVAVAVLVIVGVSWLR